MEVGRPPKETPLVAIQYEIDFPRIPLVAYAAVLGAAIALPSAPVPALFVMAGGIVFLIFLGIRNAWGVVTFLATGGPR